MEEQNNQTSTQNSSQMINQSSQEGNDISKTTITILVLITLMISVIGTWTVLNEVNNVKLTQKPSSTTGVVSLNIQQPSEPVPITGKVMLKILG
ncbi:MAG: hypothetical protein QXK76_03880 [Candidatus Woesearchaeota archaeon]